MAKKRKNAFSISFYGTSELLKKIERAGGNVEKAVGKAVSKSMEAPIREMQSFMSQHYYAGHTEQSFKESPIVWVNGRLQYYAGYNMKKGGVAALFLDVGTPKQTPTFFIYNTVQKYATSIRDTQQEILKEVFKELM